MKQELQEACDEILDMPSTTHEQNRTEQQVMDFDNPPKVKLPDSPSAYEYRDLLDRIWGKAHEKT